MIIPKKRYLIPAFVIFVLLVRFVSEIGPDRSPSDRFQVVAVVDGDTVDLLGGDRLRLLGIDCPERGEPFYDSATAFLGRLSLGKKLEVVYSDRRRDGYGRLLGYLYTDSLWINEEILRQGLGYLYLFEDNLRDSIRIKNLLAAQKNAILNGRGIWSRPVPGEPFYLTRKGSLRFHRPSCTSVNDPAMKNVIRFSSRLDAFNEGYSPCRNCRP